MSILNNYIKTILDWIATDREDDDLFAMLEEYWHKMDEEQRGISRNILALLNQAKGILREDLAEGREHLTVHGDFQSDKYPWCPAGIVPLKTTDPMAYYMLRWYANKRKEVDAEFCRDLHEALDNYGKRDGNKNLVLPELMTVPDVANYLQCSKETVRRLVGKGKLHWIKMGRLYRISRQELTDYVEECRNK